MLEHVRIRAVRIYTKTGDTGDTGLVGGTRIAKDSLKIQAIGDVDELNSAIGLARCHAENDDLGELLAQIQNWLFDIGAELATPADSKFENKAIKAAHSTRLEESMDEQVHVLPPLRNFILPGGCPLAASLHHARSVCRRAERSVIELYREEHIRSEIKVFLNRLSDWMFVSARTANVRAGVHDIVWSKSEEV